jgi:hypothetical protein
LAGQLHGLVCVFSPRLDSDIIANQQHMSATGRAGAVSKQIFGDCVITGATGHMLKDGNRNFRQQREGFRDAEKS